MLKFPSIRPALQARCWCLLGIACGLLAAAPSSVVSSLWGAVHHCAMPMSPQPGGSTGCNICEATAGLWLEENGQQVWHYPVYKRCSTPSTDQYCLEGQFSGYATPYCDKNSTTCGNVADLYYDSSCLNAIPDYDGINFSPYGCTKSFYTATMGFASGVNCTGIQPPYTVW